MIKASVRWVGYTFVAVTVLAAVFFVDHSSAALENLAIAASGIGNQVFIATASFAVAAPHLLRRRWADALWSVAPVIAVTLLAHLLKLAIGGLSPRPSGHPGGFPSIHTVTAFVLATLLTRQQSRAYLLWFSLAALVGWSRIQVGAHFAYQVAAGAVIGLEGALLTAELISAHRRRSSHAANRDYLRPDEEAGRTQEVTPPG